MADIRAPDRPRAGGVKVLHGVDFGSAAARPSASSANPAPAKRRSAARCCGWSTPARGSIVFDGRDITRSTEARTAAAAPAHADDLPGPDVLAQSAAHDRPHPRPSRSCCMASRTTTRRRRALVQRRSRSRRPAARLRRPLLRTNCPAGSASASASPAPWCCGRTSCWPTRSSPASTSRRRRRCSLLKELTREMRSRASPSSAMTSR